MPRYLVDPEPSGVTVTARPRLGSGDIPPVAGVTGSVDDVDGRLSGTLRISFAGVEGADGTGGAQDGPSLTIDVAASTPHLTEGRDGEVLLHGRTSQPASALGLRGLPMVNPTILASWRLILHPV